MTRAARFALTATLVLLPWASTDAQSAFTVQPGSRVVLIGRSNVHNWSCATSDLAAMVTVDSAPQPDGSNGRGHSVPRISIAVPVRSLDCGRARMNEDMYRALKASEFPEIRYVLRAYEFDEPLAGSDSFSVHSSGDLTVAGRTQRVDVRLSGKRVGAAIVRGEGGVKLRMTDFGIKPPTAFFGAIRTKDILEVRIEASVAVNNLMAVVATRDTTALVTAALALSARQAVDTGLRVLISIAERRMWVVGERGDTIRSAPVAVGSEHTVRSADRVWTFSTPRGVSNVVAKEENPIWIPPDWHYVEIADKQGLAIEQLRHDVPARLRDGSQLVVRGAMIGVVASDSVFRELPGDEEIVFGGTLFIPPFGTRNRRVEGVLGPYRLLLGNGIGLHGTPFKESIGTAATHGCVRLSDEDIIWLYDNVPLGTRVIIF